MFNKVCMYVLQMDHGHSVIRIPMWVTLISCIAEDNLTTIEDIVWNLLSPLGGWHIINGFTTKS